MAAVGDNVLCEAGCPDYPDEVNKETSQAQKRMRPGYLLGDPPAVAHPHCIVRADAAVKPTYSILV
jgi:hypothetical protein